MPSPEQHAEILHLYAQYAHYWDTGSADEWADLFTPDGVWERVAPSDSVEEFSEGVYVEGAEALAQFNRTLFEIEQGKVRHWSNSHLIEGDDERATATVYAMIVDVRSSQPAIAVTGIFTDELINTPDGWRFKRRSVVLAP